MKRHLYFGLCLFIRAQHYVEIGEKQQVKYNQFKKMAYNEKLANSIHLILNNRGGIEEEFRLS